MCRTVTKEDELAWEGTWFRHSDTKFTQLTVLILCWTVTKADELAWGEMKPEIFSAMMDFFASGVCVCACVRVCVCACVCAAMMDCFGSSLSLSISLSLSLSLCIHTCQDLLGNDGLFCV